MAEWPARRNELSSVQAEIAYLDEAGNRARTLVYPLSSGRENVRPKQGFHPMEVASCRDLPEAPALDGAGFEFHPHVSKIRDFYDLEEVLADYYPEMRDFLMKKTGALEVVVFDSNVRSAVRAEAGQHGVREPVQGAHVDYTPSSGPMRCLEILADAGKLEFRDHRMALVNVWRPIVGPVEDVPLCVCDVRTTRLEDFVETDIHHFGEEDLDNPRHSGQVFSLRHNPAHRWYFAPHMQPDEVLFLKGYDSKPGPCFTPHTGFVNPDRAESFTPRESIEIRTLVVYPN